MLRGKGSGGLTKDSIDDIDDIASEIGHVNMAATIIRQAQKASFHFRVFGLVAFELADYIDGNLDVSQFPYGQAGFEALSNYPKSKLATNIRGLANDYNELFIELTGRMKEPT
jgi:hypothetical protein